MPRPIACSPGSGRASVPSCNAPGTRIDGPDYGSFQDLAADVRPCADALIAAIDEAVASRRA